AVRRPPPKARRARAERPSTARALLHRKRASRATRWPRDRRRAAWRSGPTRTARPRAAGLPPEAAPFALAPSAKPPAFDPSATALLGSPASGAEEPAQSTAVPPSHAAPSAAGAAQ